MRCLIPLLPLLSLFTPTLSLSSPSPRTLVPTSPIPGMKPGTSGLRKKTSVWSDAGLSYVENFVQSVFDVAEAKGKTILVAGDGRYYNQEAMRRIFGVAGGNGVKQVYVPQVRDIAPRSFFGPLGEN